MDADVAQNPAQNAGFFSFLFFLLILFFNLLINGFISSLLFSATNMDFETEKMIRWRFFYVIVSKSMSVVVISALYIDEPSYSQFISSFLIYQWWYFFICFSFF